MPLPSNGLKWTWNRPKPNLLKLRAVYSKERGGLGGNSRSTLKTFEEGGGTRVATTPYGTRLMPLC
jgi:hypothetical protein